MQQVVYSYETRRWGAPLFHLKQNCDTFQAVVMVEATSEALRPCLLENNCRATTSKWCLSCEENINDWVGCLSVGLIAGLSTSSWLPTDYMCHDTTVGLPVSPDHQTQWVSLLFGWCYIEVVRPVCFFWTRIRRRSEYSQQAHCFT